MCMCNFRSISVCVMHDFCAFILSLFDVRSLQPIQVFHTISCFKSYFTKYACAHIRSQSDSIPTDIMPSQYIATRISFVRLYFIWTSAPTVIYRRLIMMRFFQLNRHTRNWKRKRAENWREMNFKSNNNNMYNKRTLWFEEKKNVIIICSVFLHC